jgi:branched-chain amino acid aminotransferase
MSVRVNIDGTITRAADARISVLDRGFLYGDSVYEVVRTYEGVVFALEEHLTRLESSAARLHIDVPSRDRLANEIQRTLDAAGNEESYCRVIVTRGIGPITLDPTTATDSMTVIIAKEYEPFPEWTYEEGVKVTIPNIRRTARVSLDPAIKSGNYLNSVMAFGEARRAGFFDAVMLDHQGLVTEATSSNVFIAKDGDLSTPALEHGLLAGVTRRILLDLARDNGFEVSECEITPDDLVGADEAMLTSTLREVQPVVRVGETPIGDGVPGPIAVLLRELFHRYAVTRVRD